MPSGEKRKPPAAGKGRVKGTPNKVTRELKEMILGALDQAGGIEYLAQRAIDTPGPFLALVGKVLPMTIAGDAKSPLQISWPVAPPKIEP